LPGCVAAGRNLEEALSMAPEALIFDAVMGLAETKPAS
jgi:hypothetical protein